MSVRLAALILFTWILACASAVSAGGRISRADLDSAAAVDVISAESFSSSGSINVEQLLQQQQDFSGRLLGTIPNDAPTQAIDLRGLGSGRRLTLINGHRSNPEFGLNLPLQVIERVEVIKDGAPAVYGSDAVSGVVNFVLKEDFEGMEFNQDLLTGATGAALGAEAVEVPGQFATDTAGATAVDGLGSTPLSGTLDARVAQLSPLNQLRLEQALAGHNVGYAFGSLVNDVNVAMDSLKMCDFTPGPFGSMLLMGPGGYWKISGGPLFAEVVWYDFEDELFGDIIQYDNSLGRGNGSRRWYYDDGRLISPPQRLDVGTGKTVGYSTPWAFFSTNRELPQLPAALTGSVVPVAPGELGNPLAGYDPETASPRIASALATQATFGEPFPWANQFAGSLPSRQFIDAFGNCPDRVKDALNAEWIQRDTAMANWNLQAEYLYNSDLSDVRLTAGYVREMDDARRKVDMGNLILKSYMSWCPGPEGRAVDAEVRYEFDGSGDFPDGYRPGPGSRIDQSVKALPTIRRSLADFAAPVVDITVRGNDGQGGLRTLPDTVMEFGKPFDLDFPGANATRNTELAAGDDPLRAFTNDEGVARLTLGRETASALGISSARYDRFMSLAASYRIAGDQWADFSRAGNDLSIDWDESLSTYRLSLNWQYGKFDEQVVSLDYNETQNVRRLGDLTRGFRSQMSFAAGIGYVDAFSVEDQTYGTVRYDEFADFELGLLDGYDAIQGYEPNLCGVKALPPPDEPLSKSKGSWGQDYLDQWGLDRIGLGSGKDSAWEQVQESAAPVVVGVIDSGLDWHHLDINWDNVWRNADEIPDNGIDDDQNGYIDDVIGWDFIGDVNYPWDYDGHGTFVAGIIAADRNNGAGIAGVSPNARIMVLKALNTFGHTRASHVAKAIVYGVDNGADILNISISGEGIPDVVRAAIDYANKRDVLVVVAGGNFADEVEKAYPAGIPGVLAVSSSTPSDELAAFSNYGRKIDLAAPGTDILSLRARRTDFMWSREYDPDAEKSYRPGSSYVGDDKRYYRSAGTSFSAPYVAGVAALLLGNEPTLTAVQIARMLRQSARDVGAPGRDLFFGYGILDATAALSADPEFFVETYIAGVEQVKDGKKVSLRLTGTLNANDLKRGWIEVGKGEKPDRWRRVGKRIKDAVLDAALGDIPAKEFRGADLWTIRLIGEHENGEVREYRYQVKTG